MKSSTDNAPYKTGESGYNRKSGHKTLVFVGICIILVITFSLISLIMIWNRW